MDRPLILTKNIVYNNLIAGFVRGDFCLKLQSKVCNFYINIHNSKSHKTGYQVQLRFRVSQKLKRYSINGTFK